MKKLLCRILGHIWKYNFPKNSVPSKAICARCYIKARFNPFTLEFESVPEFNGEKRTDAELSKRWF